MPENAALNISLPLVAFYFFSCSLPAHFPLGSFHFFTVFVFSDLLFVVCFHNGINTRAGASSSNVTECHAISATEYFVDLLVEDGLSSISSALVPVPIFRSLVTVYPVLRFLLTFIASFPCTTFSAKLTYHPFPHFSSILAVKGIKIFCPKT